MYDQKHTEVIGLVQVNDKQLGINQVDYTSYGKKMGTNIVIKVYDKPLDFWFLFYFEWIYGNGLPT